MPVEKAKAKDYEEFLEIFSEIEELHRNNSPWYFKKPESELFSKQYYMEIINNDDFLFLFAKDNKEIVGYIIGSKQESSNRPMFVQTKFMNIDDICVKKSHQKSGTGSILLSELENWAKANKIKDIRLNVWSFNQQAISFYENKGFQTFTQKMRKTL